MKKMLITTGIAAGLLLMLAVWLLKPEYGNGPTYGLVRQDGKVIIQAVEAYRTDYHSYPAQLSQLRPEYIDQIPKPRVYGRHIKRQLLSRPTWSYTLAPDSDTYTLSATASGSTPFGYRSVSGEWGFGVNQYSATAY